jgi:hypothetical protein
MLVKKLLATLIASAFAAAVYDLLRIKFDGGTCMIERLGPQPAPGFIGCVCHAHSLPSVPQLLCYR